MTPDVDINLLCLRSESPTGIEAYARVVIGTIPLPGDCRPRVFLPEGLAVGEALGSVAGEAGDHRHLLRHHPRLDTVRLPRRPTALRILREMLYLSWRCRSTPVVLSVNNFGPLFGGRGQRRLVVVHDVWFLSAAYNGSRLAKWLFARLIRSQLRRTHHVFTPTEHSREEIVRYTGFPRARITVTPLRVEQAPPAGEDAGFFLLVGSSRPNKNVLAAVRGHARYRAEGGDRPLVIIGPYDDAFRAQILAEGDGGVVIAGYVNEAEKWRLVGSCHALLFPSLYEGFGIPVIEAQAMGRPVLVSRGTSCEELAGDHGVVVDGSRVEDIARGCHALDRLAPVAVTVGDAQVGASDGGRCIAGQLCAGIER